MRIRRLMPPVWLTLLVLVLVLASAGPMARAGTISFSGDAALVAALGGSSQPTGVNQVASGQMVTIPFAASVAGAESVSGSLVLSDNGSGGSIEVANLVFTSSESATTTTNSITFGVTVIQDFTYTGPSAINATESLNGIAHFTGPNQIASYGTAGSLRGAPANPFTSFANSPSQGLFSALTDPFPENKAFAPGSSSLSNVGASTTGPVTAILSISTSLSTLTGYSGSGSSTSFPSVSLVFAGAVPEPASLITMGLGLVAVFGVSARAGASRSRERLGDPISSRTRR